MTKTKRLTVARSLAKFSFLVLVLFLLTGVAFGYWSSRPASQQSVVVDFEVNSGASVKSIANRLQQAGLIRQPLYFQLLVKHNKLTLQAGSYQLDSSDPPLAIANNLTRGFATSVKITIPEGYRSEQIAEVAGLPIREFQATVGDLEGRLFPDTYFVQADLTSAELVTLMHNNFLQKVGDLDRDTLILASLIERETKGDEEKPIVAGILVKRLTAGWPLELDATVQYVLGKPGAWWPNTTLLDRKTQSPYNTYLNLGLPPTPIGNPGLVSIRAAQNPVESPYWFYLHDRTGTIRYAETNDQHNQNIAKYIR